MLMAAQLLVEKREVFKGHCRSWLDRRAGPSTVYEGGQEGQFPQKVQLGDNSPVLTGYQGLLALEVARADPHPFQATPERRDAIVVVGPQLLNQESHFDETGACALNDGVDAVEVIRFRPEQRQEVVPVLDEGLQVVVTSPDKLDASTNGVGGLINLDSKDEKVIRNPQRPDQDCCKKDIYKELRKNAGGPQTRSTG